MDIDSVTQILAEAAGTVIVPRFRALAEGDVSHKARGEVVTVADREAEEIISARLRGVLDVPVVGEEAAAADPALLRAVRTAPAAWVVDPLDGTANFVAGQPYWAVMAALVRDGQTAAGWIIRPLDGLVYTAEAGGGAWRNGERLVRKPAPAGPAALRGIAHTRFLPAADRERIRAARTGFASLGPGTSCAGIDYAELAEGTADFVLFWQTLPWDHAPGTLLAREAGGVARRPDGAPYRPDDDREGLLSAADPACWSTVRPQLLG